MRIIRKLPEMDNRVETGAVRFGDDWPGLFIRGDDCLQLYLLLKQTEGMVDPLEKMFVNELLDGIYSATGQR